MTALDDFIKEINSVLFVHCLGEKITFKTDKNNTLTGDFLAINPDDANDILYHDDETCLKERINIKENIGKSSFSTNIKYKSTSKDNKSNIKKAIDDNEEILYFKIEDINLAHIKQVNTDIKCDNEISHKQKFDDIKLVEYQVDESQIDKNLISLQDDGQKFDQFGVNREKFNVETSYCESKYTTVLNYNHIPEELKIKAHKIESELLNSNKDNNMINRHLREERGFVEAKDYQDEDSDEEFKYSSVYRTNINDNKNNNK